LDTILESLLYLQKLDNSLLEIEQRKQDIPARIQALESEMKQKREFLADEKQRLKDMTLKQRSLEKELSEGVEQIKIKQSRSLDVKTNAEYKALLKEIEYTRESHSKIEDEILLLFDEIDSVGNEIQNKEKELQEEEAQTLQEKKQLEGQIDGVDVEYNKIQHEKQRLCKEMPANVLSSYDRIASRRAGQAVVIVVQNVCPGCHMLVPPQTLNEVVQTGEIRYCPHCHRILYCEQSTESTSA